MELTQLEQDRLEAAAHVLHERSHVVSVGGACNKCRATTREVAHVLWGTVDRAEPPPAA